MARAVTTRRGSRCGRRATLISSANSSAAAAARGPSRVVEFANGKVRFSIPPQWDKRRRQRNLRSHAERRRARRLDDGSHGQAADVQREARAVTRSFGHADLGRPGEAHHAARAGARPRGGRSATTACSSARERPTTSGLDADVQRLRAARRVPPAEGQQQRRLPSRPLRSADRGQRRGRASARPHRRDLRVPGGHVGHAEEAGRVADVRRDAGGPHRDRGVNGTKVICDREIPGITGGALDSDEGSPGPLMLQGDHGAIEFRNLVITPAR